MRNQINRNNNAANVNVVQAGRAVTFDAAKHAQLAVQH
jgi:hypothetical protein